MQKELHNTQVSAFGDDKESDHLDIWEVSFTGGQWMRDQKVWCCLMPINGIRASDLHQSSYHEVYLQTNAPGCFRWWQLASRLCAFPLNVDCYCFGHL